MGRTNIFFFGLDLSIISITDGHAVRSDYLLLFALRSPTLNYVIIKFPHFYRLLLYGASVPLLPASSVGTEAWVTGEYIPVGLVPHTFMEVAV